MLAWIAEAYISSMSASARDEKGLKDASSGSPETELTLLMLLMLDTEEMSAELESLPADGRGMKASIDMSCRYFKSWAHLKEWSTSSNSSSSLQRSGMCGITTHLDNTSDDESECYDPP